MTTDNVTPIKAQEPPPKIIIIEGKTKTITFLHTMELADQVTLMNAAFTEVFAGGARSWSVEEQAWQWTRPGGAVSLEPFDCTRANGGLVAFLEDFARHKIDERLVYLVDAKFSNKGRRVGVCTIGKQMDRKTAGTIGYATSHNLGCAIAMAMLDSIGFDFPGLQAELMAGGPGRIELPSTDIVVPG